MGQHREVERDKSNGNLVMIICVIAIILLLVGTASFISSHQTNAVTTETMQDVGRNSSQSREITNPEPKWFEVGRHVNGDTYFIDLISLKKNGDDIYSWELTNYSVPSKVGSRSALLYFESKCNTPKKRRILSATFYKGLMGAGEINSLVQEQGWEYPVPGSINDMVMAFICSK